MVDIDLRTLDRAARATPSFNSFFKYGSALLRAGRRHDARVQFWHALDYWKNSPSDAQTITQLFPDLSYKLLVWEKRAYRSSLHLRKQRFSFHDSLVRLQSAGYERHARPHEVFGLLSDGMRGLLPRGSVWQKIYQDMISNYGEWLSIAFERQKNKLLVYVDPEDLVWNQINRCYEKGPLFHASYVSEFHLPTSSQVPFNLRFFSHDFVHFLCKCPYQELPTCLREGMKSICVWVTSQGTPWPVGRGNINFVVGGPGYVWASRGICTFARFKNSPSF